jgi:hypothetical protein
MHEQHVRVQVSNLIRLEISSMGEQGDCFGGLASLGTPPRNDTNLVNIR